MRLRPQLGGTAPRQTVLGRRRPTNRSPVVSSIPIIARSRCLLSWWALLNITHFNLNIRVGCVAPWLGEPFVCAGGATAVIPLQSVVGVFVRVSSVFVWILAVPSLAFLPGYGCGG